MKLDSTGRLVSPPVTDYTGMDVDGAGWGTAVTKDGTLKEIAGWPAIPVRIFHQ